MSKESRRLRRRDRALRLVTRAAAIAIANGADEADVTVAALSATLDRHPATEENR